MHIIPVVMEGWIPYTKSPGCPKERTPPAPKVWCYGSKGEWKSASPNMHQKRKQNPVLHSNPAHEPTSNETACNQQHVATFNTGQPPSVFERTLTKPHSQNLFGRNRSVLPSNESHESAPAMVRTSLVKDEPLQFANPNVATTVLGLTEGVHWGDKHTNETWAQPHKALTPLSTQNFKVYIRHWHHFQPKTLRH